MTNLLVISCVARGDASSRRDRRDQYVRTAEAISAERIDRSAKFF
jgi:hypothetical protein